MTAATTSPTPPDAGTRLGDAPFALAHSDFEWSCKTGITGFSRGSVPGLAPDTGSSRGPGTIAPSLLEDG
jgi:hypothetical protein